MSLQIRVHVASDQKAAARALLTDIRRCDSHFNSLLEELSYPTYDGALVLSRQPGEAIRRALERSGRTPKVGTHRVEGMVGGRMVPLVPTGARVEIIVDYAGLVGEGASSEEITYICAHEMSHCAMLRARSSIGLLEDHYEDPGAAHLVQQLVEEYEAVISGSAIATGVISLSAEHSAAIEGFNLVNAQVYIGPVVNTIRAADEGWTDVVNECRSGNRSAAVAPNLAMSILSEVFVLLAHAQAFTDIAETAAPLDALPRGFVGDLVRRVWEKVAPTLRPFASLPGGDDLPGLEAHAVEIGVDALHELLRAMTLALNEDCQI